MFSRAPVNPRSLSTYPSGHLGHLTAEQSKAYDEFKDLCEKANYWRSDQQTIGYDDATLLRFLRARKFVPKDAFDQFDATEKWREEQQVEDLYDTIDIEQYEDTRLVVRMVPTSADGVARSTNQCSQYTHWTGRRDKRGIPLYVFRIGALDDKALAAQDAAEGSLETVHGLSPKLRRLFATYEHLTGFVMPLCTALPSRPYPETPISQTCNIVDVSGVGLRQFWTLRSHLQDAGALATAHYPETLGLTFIIGAPSFFPTFWNSIKRWFDPITVAKVFILSASEVESTLAEYVEIKDIPKRYGGELDWEFGQMPNLDPKILESLKLDDGRLELPKGPVRWLQSEDGKRMEAHALGTDGGVQRDYIFGHIDCNTFYPPVENGVED